VFEFVSLVLSRQFTVNWSRDLITNCGTRVANLWDLAPCSPYVNWCYGGKFELHVQGRKSEERETGAKQVARPSHYTALYPWRWQQHSSFIIKPLTGEFQFVSHLAAHGGRGALGAQRVRAAQHWPSAQWSADRNSSRKLPELSPDMSIWFEGTCQTMQPDQETESSTVQPDLKGFWRWCDRLCGLVGRVPDS
jgi:hypothetical protein